MIMIGYSGLFIIALVCMIIGGVIYAMCRVSGDCSREEEREFDKASCRSRNSSRDSGKAIDKDNRKY